MALSQLSLSHPASLVGLPQFSHQFGRENNSPPLSHIIPLAHPLKILHSIIGLVSTDMVDDIRGVRAGGTIQLHDYLMNFLVTSHDHVARGGNEANHPTAHLTIH